MALSTPKRKAFQRDMLSRLIGRLMALPSGKFCIAIPMAKAHAADMEIVLSATIDDAMIRIPVSDGRKVYPVVLNIKKTVESEGRELVRAISKSITLYRIDESWKEHLREMDDLKQSVQNATYEQKDPLLIYKFESFNLFSTMLEELSKQVSAFLLRANIPLRDGGNQTAEAPAAPRKPDMSQMNTSRTDLVTNAGEPKSKMPVHVEKQVGRNDPCPCGSGKKFKNCHGKAQA